MKLTIKNLSKGIFSEASKILFFFMLAAFPVALQAQSVNGDLGKSSPAPARTPKRGKHPARGGTKPTTDTAHKPGSYRQPVQTTSAAPAPAAPAAPAAPPAPVVPPPTPEQILDRFMNLQQSASVGNSDWQSVVSQTNAALESNPNNAKLKAQLFIAQGELAYNRSDFSSALVQFNAAAQALPDSSLPHYGIGKIYLDTKQPNEAQDAFQRAIRLNKDFALAYKGMGDALTALGKTKKAQEYYKQAAQRGLVGEKSGVTVPSGATSTAGTSAGSSQSGSASDPAALTPESANAREIERARQLTARKQWQQSIDTLMPLTKSNPAAEVYIAIGDNYAGMEQWLSAQQAYQKATETNPKAALGFYKLGTVLYEMNEFQGASDAFEKSLILDLNGMTINRAAVRRLADKAKEKAEGGRKKKLGIF